MAVVIYGEDIARDRAVDSDRGAPRSETTTAGAQIDAVELLRLALERGIARPGGRPKLETVDGPDQPLPSR